MTAQLEPHQATYTLLDAAGRAAGNEDLRFARLEDGWQLTSSLASTFPAELTASIDWRLDRDLRTRLLRIESTVDGMRLNLELAVTGNGLLAHRSAPDGPTQVEMGWGPGVELDYLSAAFPAVMAARSRLGVGDRRRADVVHIGTEDLLPGILALELSALDAATIEVLVPATGHRATLSIGQAGALLGYEGLFRLDVVTVSK
jgi:hypothetical protein